MKKIPLFIIILFLLNNPVFAWKVTNYYVQLDVQKDGRVVVTEKITADFTGDPHHGIIRDIPIYMKDKLNRETRLKFDIQDVLNESGNKIQSVVSGENGWISIKIGDPNVMVSDVRTYVIRYTVSRLVQFFDDHDEIYWNAVGTQWEVPIEKASCVVNLPGGIPPGKIKIASYSGPYGSKTSDVNMRVIGESKAKFVMKKPLAVREGMTVVVGWPKNIVNPPSIFERFLMFIIEKGWQLLLPAIIPLGLYIWLSKGRDPETYKSEMVVYEPPDDLSPAEIGTLIDETVNMRDISSSIINLAVRGFIKIHEQTKKVLLFTNTEYSFELTKSYNEVLNDDSLSDFDRELIKSIFKGWQTRELSQLRNEFYKSIPQLQDTLYNSVVNRGYFARRPDKVRNSYIGYGIAAILLGTVASVLLTAAKDNPKWIGLSAGYGLVLIAYGFMLLLLAKAMPRKTKKGKDALIAVRGFKEYLSRAEKDDIQYQEKLGLFEKFLPYAMVLGVAERWAKAFEGLANEPPEWYSGQSEVFRATAFAKSLSNATSAWATTMKSTPSSKGSSGGSGFSGGFSGGGGGGGGGRGW